MKSCSAIAMCLVAATAIQNVDAKTLTIVKSSSGKVYIDSPNGMIEYDALKVVDLTDDTTPSGPNPTDKFGLIKVSRESAANVADYSDKENHATTLGAYYTGLATAVESGTIPQDKLGSAVDSVFKIATGPDAEKWSAWKTTTDQAFNAAPINNATDAAQGLRDIGTGLQSESNAVDWEKLIQFFIEVILPLIISLIGGDS